MIKHDLDFTKAIHGSPGGATAIFIPINDDWGVKFFPSMDVRNMAYEKQKKFADLGFAPEVGDTIELPGKGVLARNQFSNKFYKFGYYTERVTPILDYEDLESLYHPIQGVDVEKEVFEIYGKKVNDLINKIKNAKLRMYDIHAGNFGIDKNGNMVVIDFS